MLHIRFIRKPSKTMDMRTAAMLLFEAEPVVGGTKNSNVESIDEFDNALIEEPVSDGQVLLDSFTTS